MEHVPVDDHVIKLLSLPRLVIILLCRIKLVFVTLGKFGIQINFYLLEE